MKPRMTKQRVKVLENLKSHRMMWGFTERGCREFWYDNGSYPNHEIIEGMLKAGFLKISEDGPLGIGQEIVRQESAQ